MKYLIGIVTVVIIIAVSPTPSEAQKKGMTGRQCAALAVQRGERPGRPHDRRFIRECRRGLIPA